VTEPPHTSAETVRAPAEPEAFEAVGFSLEATEACAAGRPVGQPASAARMLPLLESPLPPAALPPRFPGEPVGVDLEWPPHPRGSGDIWPPEARVETGEAPGRLPMGYAFSALRRGLVWRWDGPDGASRLHPADAIAHVLRGSMAALDPSVEPAEPVACALAVPDAWNAAARKQVVEAAQGLRVEPRPIPRSEAGAALWCDAFAERLPDPAEAASAPGRILALHLGLDEWEASILDLRPTPAPETGGPLWTPVRRDPGPPLPSYGLELMHHLASRSLEMSYRRAGPGRIWELLWCTPWMNAALNWLDGEEIETPAPLRTLAAHVRTREFIRQQCRYATHHILGIGPELPGLLRDYLEPSPEVTGVRDWLAGRRDRSAEPTLLGAVATGPMAAMPHEDGTLGEHALRRIWPKAESVLIERRDFPPGGLARGALLRAAALSEGAGDGPP
jgi:hypothetical protein